LRHADGLGLAADATVVAASSPEAAVQARGVQALAAALAGAVGPDERANDELTGLEPGDGGPEVPLAQEGRCAVVLAHANVTASNLTRASGMRQRSREVLASLLSRNLPRMRRGAQTRKGGHAGPESPSQMLSIELLFLLQEVTVVEATQDRVEAVPDWITLQQSIGGRWRDGRSSRQMVIPARSTTQCWARSEPRAQRTSTRPIVRPRRRSPAGRLAPRPSGRRSCSRPRISSSHGVRRWFGCSSRSRVPPSRRLSSR